jgi:general secretion pathway protein G
MVMEENHQARKFTWNLCKALRTSGFLDTLLISGRLQKHMKAYTMVELLLAVAILGTLSAIAVPTYGNYRDKARNATAMVDIREMELDIVRFQAERGRLPDTLAEAGLTTLIDPWGRPYQYMKIQGVDKKDLKGVRKDRFVHPLNTDFDLYSMGKDGDSVPALTAKASHDDIIRANNGAFVGLASEY